MKKSLPKIADSEWRIMKILWKQSPKSAQEIIDILEHDADWTAKTIKTLLNRLVNKGALGYDKESRSYLYYPLVDEKECAKKESRSFLNRVYDGALTPMIASFIEENPLSEKDLDELRQIVDQKREN